MSKIFLLPVLAALLFLPSCSKKISGINWNFSDRNRMEIRELDFEYLSSRGKIQFRDDKNDINARANIRIRKDSVIWMNFSSVGIQGGRALINQDSISIINTMNKEYYVFTFSDLSERFNFEINYQMIQAALLGNLLKPREDEDEVIKKDTYFHLIQNTDSLIIENFINRRTMKLERLSLKEIATNNHLKISYGDFQLVNDMAFPYSTIISLIYTANEDLVNTSIQIEYNKAELADKELKFPFNIPKRFERK